MPVNVGKIKWFDSTKGFGFVLDDAGGDDILLHANVLRDYGLSSVIEGSELEVETVETERGRQVVKIISLELPETPVAQQADFPMPNVDVSGQPLEPGRVKWFDKAKGFGFVNIFGSSDDIFLHVEVLRSYGMAELQQGEAISVKVSDGPRGKMVFEVRPWDHSK